MATLISCPNCQTCYEVKAAFPPAGRRVRCYKCGQVWHAQPGASVPEPASAAAATPSAQPKPEPKPVPSSPGLGGFSDITEPAARPLSEASLTDRLSETKTDAEFDAGEDHADQVAQINAQATAEESGGIYSRLAARRSAPPLRPPHSAMSDAVMGDDAAFTDVGLDPALVAAMAGADSKTLLAEKPPRSNLLLIIMGWTALGLVIALIPSALI